MYKLFVILLEGIGWFTYETFKRITRNHPEHTFIFIFDRPYSEEFVFSSNIKPVVVYPPTRHPVLWYFWFEFALPQVFKKHKVDLFISPDGFISLKTKIPSLTVIHDLNFEHRPQDLPYLTRLFYTHFYPKYANKATQIATVSGFSKRDIVETYNIAEEKIDVVYNGAAEQFAPLSAEGQKLVRDKYAKGAEYFVFIGALHPRKNIVRLMSAFDAFRQETKSGLKLVIVGDPMFKTKDIREVYQRLESKDAIIFTGRLSKEELPKVIASAYALTFVPYFEGFGIPILEAMQCGVPVITSALTSMPEVAGEAAILVNPYSVAAIKEAMILISSNNEIRNALIEKGKIQCRKFSWEETAQNLWKSVLKCMKRTVDD